MAPAPVCSSALFCNQTTGRQKLSLNPTDKEGQLMWHFFDKGGAVMYPLLICSIIALSVVIERAVFWLMVSLRSKQSLADEVLELSRRGEWESVRAKTANAKDFIVKILVSGIINKDFSMLKAMESTAASEIQHMRRFMNVLDTMITVAPLLGIFGTVLGIIASFEELGTAGIERVQEVTNGIGQALITTAAGLGIAIVSDFFYNYYNSRIEDAAQRIEKYATRLEILYEKQTQSPSPKIDSNTP